MGLSLPNNGVLKVLWEQDNQSGVGLGERLVLDNVTIAGLFDRLEQADLIERKAHATGRWVNRVVLITRGRDLQVSLDRDLERMNQDFLNKFSPEAVASLQDLLVAIAQKPV